MNITHREYNPEAAIVLKEKFRVQKYELNSAVATERVTRESEVGYSLI